MMLRRTSSAAILGLHVVVVALAPQADARLDAASRGQETHVEAPDRPACAPSHNHLYCQLCRVFTLSGAKSGGYRLDLPAEGEGALPAFAPVLAATPARRTPAQPRAPPLS